MTASKLPEEVLHNIFRRLDGRDVLPCRAVCRLWRAAVESLSDSDWQRICSNERRWYDYPAFYNNVRKKNGLSWRDTYRAVNSWSNIGSAGVRILELCDDVLHCKVLPHGVLACPKSTRRNKYRGLSDSVIYYNTETLQECGREKFSFDFATKQYNENEYFYVLVYCNHVNPQYGKLCIILKENKQQYFVGILKRTNAYGIHFKNYTLMDREVYFKNIDNLVFVSKLIEKDGILSVRTAPVCNEEFKENVIEFGCKDDKLFVLTDMLDVYINTIEGWNILRNVQKSKNNFYYLKYRGFDWRCPALKNYFAQSEHIEHVHCNVVVKTNDSLNSYSYNPDELHIVYLENCIYGSVELSDMLACIPTKSIDLKSVLSDRKEIQQVEVIETGRNHNLVILCDDKVFLIEISPCFQTTPMTLRSSIKPIYVKSKMKKKFYKKKRLQNMLKKE